MMLARRQSTSSNALKMRLRATSHTTPAVVHRRQAARGFCAAARPTRGSLSACHRLEGARHCSPQSSTCSGTFQRSHLHRLDRQFSVTTRTTAWHRHPWHHSPPPDPEDQEQGRRDGGTGHKRDCFPGKQDVFTRLDWFERRSRRHVGRMDRFRREVEYDPYRALFGASNHALGWTHDPWTEAARKPNQTAEKNTAAASENDGSAAEYDIDPITLRKMPRKSVPEAAATAPLGEASVDIPVKKFDAGEKTAKREQNVSSKPEPKRGFFSATESSHSTAATSSLESALDRHLNKKKQTDIPAKADALRYEPKEVTTDDVDLLRPSAIRAAAGAKARTQTNPGDKIAKQALLNDSYDRQSTQLDAQLAKEIASSASLTNPVTDAEHPDLLRTSLPKHSKSDSIANIDEKVAQMKTKLVPLKVRMDLLGKEYSFLRKQLLDEKRRKEAVMKKAAAQQVLDSEVDQHKAAMQRLTARSQDAAASASKRSASSTPHEYRHSEGDVASNVHEFLHRDRWYKQKAPHAQGEMEKKLQRIAREKSFVKEIKTIYEDTYGPINIAHRQKEVEQEAASSTSSSSSSSANVSASTVDSLIANLVTQDLPPAPQAKERLVFASRELLPLEKEISNDLRGLLFNLDDYQQKAASESQQSERDAITRMGATAIAESGIRLMLAGLRLALSGGALNYDALIKEMHRAAGSELATMAGRKNEQAAPSGTSNATSSAAAAGTASTAATAAESGGTYRILALDQSAERVVSAKISAQAPLVGEQQLTPLQALNSLRNPGKFLPQLMTLYQKGYEVVSGSRDVLVLKLAPGARSVMYRGLNGRPINPIDGMMTPPPEVYTGNFASPTGFVNLDPVLPPEELEQALKLQQAQLEKDKDKDGRGIAAGDLAAGKDVKAASIEHGSGKEEATPAQHDAASSRDSAPKVRREEDVFSGSNNAKAITAAAKTDRTDKKTDDGGGGQQSSTKKGKAAENPKMTGYGWIACIGAGLFFGVTYSIIDLNLQLMRSIDARTSTVAAGDTIEMKGPIGWLYSSLTKYKSKRESFGDSVPRSQRNEAGAGEVVVVAAAAAAADDDDDISAPGAMGWISGFAERYWQKRDDFDRRAQEAAEQKARERAMEARLERIVREWKP